MVHFLVIFKNLRQPARKTERLARNPKAKAGRLSRA